MGMIRIGDLSDKLVDKRRRGLRDWGMVAFVGVESGFLQALDVGRHVAGTRDVVKKIYDLMYRDRCVQEDEHMYVACWGGREPTWDLENATSRDHGA